MPAQRRPPGQDHAERLVRTPPLPPTPRASEPTTRPRRSPSIATPLLDYAARRDPQLIGVRHVRLATNHLTGGADCVCSSQQLFWLSYWSARHGPPSGAGKGWYQLRGGWASPPRRSKTGAVTCACSPTALTSSQCGGCPDSCHARALRGPRNSARSCPRAKIRARRRGRRRPGPSLPRCRRPALRVRRVRRCARDLLVDDLRGT